MKKSLTAAMAAITFGGAVAAATVPAVAEARDYRGYEGGRYYGDDYRRGGRNDAGVAVAAGIVGLALGAALTSGNRASGYGPYGYAGGYAAPGYYDRGYYDRGYQVCEARRLVWDPYIRRQVVVRSRYAC